MNRPFPVRPHKMTPRGLQLPLLVLAGTSHRSIAAPLATSIFFSFCGVKNATQRESGDQNGLYAPSLPGRSGRSDPASGRTHNGASPAGRPTKASMVPSGDRANPPSPLTAKRKLGSGGGGGEGVRDPVVC